MIPFLPILAGLSWKKTIKPMLIGLLVLIPILTLWYVDRLREKNVELGAKVESQQEIITGMEKDHQKITAAKDDLSKTVDVLRKDSEELRDTLYRERRNKKSLEELALAKSELIEKMINAASLHVLECLEIITGKPNEKNISCP